MKKLLVAGGVTLMACMLLAGAGCGGKKSADGREIKARPKPSETEVIPPPEAAFDLKGDPGARKK